MLMGAGSNPVLTTKKIKIMKINTKDKLKVLGLMIFFTTLLVYAFYIHKNEPHWFQIRYVKVIK
jgi:hypothetical protein